eukprot:7389696-Prymnesium_polylepis.1
MLAVCHGATRGGGMLFPCLCTAVLAHTDATFGFPEIRRGALPGVVSVAARQRLSAVACKRLMCTGDVIGAGTARELGLVDFVGSWAQIEVEAARLLARWRALGVARLKHCCAPPSPVARACVTEVEMDEARTIARVDACASGDTPLEEHVCDALVALSEAVLPSLRVVVLKVSTGGGERPSAASRVEAARLAVVGARLAERGVTIVCTAQGHVSDGALLACAMAHYRIVEEGASFECGDDAAVHEQLRVALRPSDAAELVSGGRADAQRALSLGLASEVVQSGAAERAVQFACWLALQPVVGMQHVLQLSYRGVSPVRAPPAIELAAVRR